MAESTGTGASCWEPYKPAVAAAPVKSIHVEETSARPDKKRDDFDREEDEQENNKGIEIVKIARNREIVTEQ